MLCISVGILVARRVRLQDLSKSRDADGVLARMALRLEVRVRVPIGKYGGYGACIWIGILGRLRGEKSGLPGCRETFGGVLWGMSCRGVFRTLVENGTS